MRKTDSILPKKVILHKAKKETGAIQEIIDDLNKSRNKSKIHSELRTFAGDAVANSASDISKTVSKIPLVSAVSETAIEGLRRWNAFESEKNKTAEIIAAETYAKRRLLSSIEHPSTDLSTPASFEELKSQINYHRTLSAVREEHDLPECMSQTLDCLFQKSLAEIVSIGASGVEKNYEAIAKIRESIEEERLAIRNGFEAINEKILLSAEQIAKKLNLSQAVCDDICKGEINLLRDSNELSEELDNIRQVTNNSDDLFLNIEKKEMIRESLRAFGEFGSLISAPDITLTCQVASTSIDIFDAMTSLASVDNLLGFLDPMLFVGKGIMSIVSLFSPSAPDPILEQIKMLAEKIDELHFELKNSVRRLEQGQKEILECVCRGFSEVTTLMLKQNERSNDFLRTQISDLGEKLYFSNGVLSKQMEILLLKDLIDLAEEYELTNLVDRISEKKF